MLSRPRIAVGGLDIQHLTGGIERVDIKLCNFQRIFFLFAGGLFEFVSAFVSIVQQVPHIGDVHDVVNGIPLKFQKPLQQVGH